MVKKTGNIQNDDEMPIKDFEVNELRKRILATSATSFMFGSFVMAWFNTYLSKPIPHFDGTTSTGVGESTEGNTPSTTTSPSHGLTKIQLFEMDWELAFVTLCSTSAGLMFSITFVCYHLDRFVCVWRRNRENAGNKFERLTKCVMVVQVILGIGAFLGILAVSFSIYVFHASPMYPFLCFVIPLAVCALGAFLFLYFVF